MNDGESSKLRTPGQSVGLETVARVLNLIVRPPNKRTSPEPGDLEGNYDYWFDGGACRFDTGSTRYDFSDGTVAWGGSCMDPKHLATVEYPDGKLVTVIQTR